jgi:hypothetical protein
MALNWTKTETGFTAVTANGTYTITRKNGKFRLGYAGAPAPVPHAWPDATTLAVARQRAEAHHATFPAAVQTLPELLAKREKLTVPPLPETLGNVEAETAPPGDGPFPALHRTDPAPVAVPATSVSRADGAPITGWLS